MSIVLVKELNSLHSRDFRIYIYSRFWKYPSSDVFLGLQQVACLVSDIIRIKFKFNYLIIAQRGMVVI